MNDSLVQLSCLKEACKRNSIPFSVHDDNGNVVRVRLAGEDIFFCNFATPFNSASTEAICKDKEFTYLLLKDKLNMPKTRGYFDPQYGNEGYSSYIKFNSEKEILADAFSFFNLPLIVKRNSGQRGINVFLCKSESDVLKSVSKIFSKTPDYDYVALIQEYIEPKTEYRAVVLDGKAVLVYRKDISSATFMGNLSPLHYAGAKAVHVTDAGAIKKIESFLSDIFDILPVRFAGFDIIEDKSGKLWLIEINTRPGFSIFIRDNGSEPVVEMYGKLLDALSGGYTLVSETKQKDKYVLKNYRSDDSRRRGRLLA